MNIAACFECSVHFQQIVPWDTALWGDLPDWSDFHHGTGHHAVFLSAVG